jgi:hypothetical protein
MKTWPKIQTNNEISFKVKCKGKQRKNKMYVYFLIVKLNFHYLAVIASIQH